MYDSDYFFKYDSSEMNCSVAITLRKAYERESEKERNWIIINIYYCFHSVLTTTINNNNNNKKVKK